MPKLSDIKETLKQVVGAISAALGLDVEVIDSNLERLVGTGVFEKLVGEKIPESSITKRVLLHKKQNYIANNPGYDELCKPCDLFGKCSYKFALYSPIIHNDKTLGILAISAMDNDMATKIKSNLASF